MFFYRQSSIDQASFQIYLLDFEMDIFGVKIQFINRRDKMSGQALLQRFQTPSRKTVMRKKTT